MSDSSDHDFLNGEELTRDVLASWVGHLRHRYHDLTNRVMKLDIRLQSLQVQHDERHRTITDDVREMKQTMAGFGQKLDDVKDAVTRVNVRQVTAVGLVVWIISNMDQIQKITQ